MDRFPKRLKKIYFLYIIERIRHVYRVIRLSIIRRSFNFNAIDLIRFINSAL